MKSSSETLLRSFGMSGYQLTEEILSIEKVFKIAMGHVSETNKASEDLYYGQFEQQVRTEASEMAVHYKAFYCLEKSIRKLISETMEEVVGASWWDSGKNQQCVKDVSDRIQREIDSGVTRRSMDHLDYTTFGELSGIITGNWDIFGSIFNSKRAVERVLANLNTLRGPIAHCSRLSEDEVIRLQLTVRDWFRTMQ
jgi:hypothetical protein